jgi:low affinity Fe/Cu permease
MNPTYVKNMPVVGKNLDKPRLCIHHQGSLISFLTSVYMLPDTKTAIVVLTNSMAINNVADWIGELILETVLDNPEKNDYLSIARQTAKEYARMAEELERRRQKGTRHRPLDEYVGACYNAVENWRFEVFP